jgi:hypothetical protein
MPKEELSRLFERHITVYPIRHTCGIPVKPKKYLSKKNPIVTAE